MNQSLIRTGGVFLLVLLATRALAVQPGQEHEPKLESGEALSYVPPSWPEAPSAGVLLMRLCFGTAAVLSLCVGTLWLMAKRHGARTATKGSGTQLGLVATLPLANRSALYLLRVGTQQVVAAVDGSGLKALIPITGTGDREIEQALTSDGASSHLMASESGRSGGAP
jgi:flagellar biogenesis protein FliO